LQLRSLCGEHQPLSAAKGRTAIYEVIRTWRSMTKQGGARRFMTDGPLLKGELREPEESEQRQRDRDMGLESLARAWAAHVET
jgi:hypothetical protein